MKALILLFCSIVSSPPLACADEFSSESHSERMLQQVSIPCETLLDNDNTRRCLWTDSEGVAYFVRCFDDVVFDVRSRRCTCSVSAGFGACAETCQVCCDMTLRGCGEFAGTSCPEPWTSSCGEYEIPPSFFEPPPTPLPTRDPTPSPTPDPTSNPTPRPTIDPTPPPTSEPTPRQTPSPTFNPTVGPELELTAEPTRVPTPRPSLESATDEPTLLPGPDGGTDPSPGQTQRPTNPDEPTPPLTIQSLSSNPERCPALPDHIDLLDDQCCHPSLVECENMTYCFGAMLSYSGAVFSEYCCDYFPGCVQTKDLEHSLDLLRALSITDFALSCIVCLLVFIKIYEISLDRAQANARCGWLCHFPYLRLNFQLPNGVQYLRSTIFIVLFDFVDLTINISILSIVHRRSPDRKAQDIIDAGCFPHSSSTQTISNAISLLEPFKNVAIAEAVIDVLAIALHLFEVEDDDEERPFKPYARAFGAACDFAELVLAAVNLFVNLLPVFSAFEDLYDNFGRQDDFTGGNDYACVYACCGSALVGSAR